METEYKLFDKPFFQRFGLGPLVTFSIVIEAFILITFAVIISYWNEINVLIENWSTYIVPIIGIIITISAIFYIIIERIYIFRKFIKEKDDKEIIRDYIDAPIRNSFAWLIKQALRPSAVFVECIILIVLSYLFSDEIYNWLGLNAPDVEVEKTAQSYRNRGFALAAFIGLFVTTIGMGLTIWGRVQTIKQTEQTQKQIEQAQEEINLTKKIHAYERYQNATKMLGEPAVTVRTDACSALASIGVVDEDLAKQCIHSALNFISNPYFSEHENFNFEHLTDEEKVVIFPTGRRLSADIRAAAKSLFAIYRHYYSRDEEVDFGSIILPNYFLKNTEKDPVFLSGAKIQKDMQNAYLQQAMLEGIHSNYINFENANLIGANLSGADLYMANFTNAELDSLVCNKAKLIKAVFNKSDLNNAEFDDTNLTGASFKKANLSSVDFEGANLSGTNFKNAILQYAYFENADLTGAHFDGVTDLSVDQILSATWGSRKANRRRKKITKPNLPAYLMKDPEIIIWLDKPPRREYEINYRIRRP